MPTTYDLSHLRPTTLSLGGKVRRVVNGENQSYAHSGSKRKRIVVGAAGVAKKGLVVHNGALRSLMLAIGPPSIFSRSRIWIICNPTTAGILTRPSAHVVVYRSARRRQVRGRQ
ncbi:hypothetical protein EVAR_27013_1 [Eumeta japonica]|uniref:Uncharacterized protein n=1 Tax=Eumeta variegata TaxID=151549 RepID=A0A4C1Z7R7_EUMVA|nr:hypothetical protein EVAR_27013_1 [Eumeta japonica]